MSQDRFFRNSAFGMLAGVFSALGSLVATVIVARLLGVEGAGAFSLGVWVAAMALVFADLGIPVTLARFMPELATRDAASLAALPPALARPFRLTVAAAFVAIVALGSLGLTFGSTHAEVGRSPLFWTVIGCAFLCQAFASFGLACLRGLQRFDEVARLNALSLVLQLLVTAGGSLLAGVSGALAGYVAGNLLAASASLRFQRGQGTADPDVTRRAWIFARTSWMTAIISAIVWTRVEVVPLQLYWGSAAVGLFSVTLTLSQIATQLPTLLMSGLLPHFAERHAAGDWAGLHRAFASTLVFFSFLLLPACFGMAALAPSLVPTLFGAAFAPAVPAAEILALAASIAAISSVNANVIYAAERADFFLKAGIGSAILMVAAAIVVIPHYGVIGAALSRAAIQGGVALLSFWYVRDRLGCPIPLGPLARLVLAAGLCGVVARIVVVWVDGPVELPLAIAAGAATYLAACRALGALPPADAERLRGVAMRALPRRLHPATAFLWGIAFGPTGAA